MGLLCELYYLLSHSQESLRNSLLFCLPKEKEKLTSQRSLGFSGNKHQMFLVQALKVEEWCGWPPQALEGVLTLPVDVQESAWT